MDSFKYGFVTLPKDIGLEILIGIGLASLITVFEPIQHLISQYLHGALAYSFVIVFGLLTYVCSTASVPMGDALIQSWLTSGQAMTYLIVGPITSYGSLLVLRKDFGNRILTAYLLIICICALLCGIMFDILDF